MPAAGDAVLDRQDSSVMLHLALKAFAPAKLPFPLLQVDTTWKFREITAFGDETARRLGLELLVHINADGLAKGINPFRHGSALHTDVMKTQAFKQALDRHRFDAVFGGAPATKRNRAPRSASRVAEVAKLMVDARLIVLISFISPFRAERRMRQLLPSGEFFEIVVDTRSRSPSVAIRRVCSRRPAEAN
jgi:hypothetical protein